MSQPVHQPPANVEITKGPDYREAYANSVQVRANLWDFFLMFGTMDQTGPDSVKIENFQGVYLSPQQAKALSNLLHQNIEQYEGAFGEIRLQPVKGKGAVH
jgi:flagellar protein FlaG